MKNQHDLFNYLDSLHIVHETYPHQPVFSVQESDAVLEQLPAFGPCRSLFLKDKKQRLWLVTALFETKFALKDLSKQLKAPHLQFASPQILLETLGVTPGSVTPLALINDEEHKVTVILDPHIFLYDKIGVHPLTNNATTLLAPSDLKLFILSCGNSIQELPSS